MSPPLTRRLRSTRGGGTQGVALEAMTSARRNLEEFDDGGVMPGAQPRTQRASASPQAPDPVLSCGAILPCLLDRTRTPLPAGTFQTPLRLRTVHLDDGALPDLWWGEAKTLFLMAIPAATKPAAYRRTTASLSAAQGPTTCGPEDCIPPEVGRALRPSTRLAWSRSPRHLRRSCSIYRWDPRRASGTIG